MIIEAICVVAGAVPGVAWAWWRHRKDAQKIADYRGMASERISEICDLSDQLADTRDSLIRAVSRNRILEARNNALVSENFALQPKPKAPPMRGKNGRFVAREVQA